MSAPWIDLPTLKNSLSDYFQQNRQSLSTFGNTVNQTFEAFVFAAVIGWYRKRGWNIRIENPVDAQTGNSVFRLKFSTRGRPSNYSYARCFKEADEVHVRHQLRVATYFHRDGNEYAANVCLDVAVIRPMELDEYSTKDALPNPLLITFGEAKHMSAFAELVAGFIGLVHELQPQRLASVRTEAWTPDDVPHPSPFLYVSGIMYYSGQGIKDTISQRAYDIDIFTQTESLSPDPTLPATTR
jgi:hypothetical protein